MLLRTSEQIQIKETNLRETTSNEKRVRQEPTREQSFYLAKRPQTSNLLF